jgi:hypothetical protein
MDQILLGLTPLGKISRILTLPGTTRVCTDPDHFDTFFPPLARSKNIAGFCPTVHYYIANILQMLTNVYIYNIFRIESFFERYPKPGFM